MRNFKLFLLAAVVMAATLFIYSCAKDASDQKISVSELNLPTEARSIDPCVKAGNCQGLIYQDATATVSIPSYPNCTFELVYRFRTCGSQMDLILDSWGPNPVCQDFDDDLDAMILANSPNIALFIQQLQKQMMTALANQLASNNPLTPLCGSGDPATSFGFTSGSCIKFCLIQPKKVIGDGLTLWRVIQIPCGSACCRTTYEICRNPDGSLNTSVQQYSTEAVPGSCQSQSPQLPCPRGTVYSTPCIPNCQAL